MPKLIYILRTASCSGNPRLTIFDDALRQGLSSIPNVSLTDDYWLQASLPVQSGGLGVRSAGILASSAYLASAAATPYLQTAILANSCSTTSDPAVNEALTIWKTLSQAEEPVAPGNCFQKVSDNTATSTIYEDLLRRWNNNIDKARLKAAGAANADDWRYATSIHSLVLRLSGEAIRVAVGHRLGSSMCHPHTWACGTQVDARGLHGLACKKIGPRHIHHAMVNDIIWRAIKKTQVPASKEAVGLSREGVKRPDGATLIPWACGKPIAWDVAVPDTYAQSHLNSTSLQAGAAADNAAITKKTKYTGITNSHIFIPVAIETGGSWNAEATELIQDIGKRITIINGEPRETALAIPTHLCRYPERIYVGVPEHI